MKLSVGHWNILSGSDLNGKVKSSLKIGSVYLENMFLIYLGIYLNLFSYYISFLDLFF